MSLCIRQTCALFRKTALVRLRSPVALALEIALPLGFVLAMLALSGLSIFATKHVPAADHASDSRRILPFLPLPALLARAGTGGIIAISGEPGAADAAKQFFDAASALYAPVSIRALAGGALAAADVTGILGQLDMPGFVNCSKYFSSPADIDTYVGSASYGSISTPSIYAAIVFDAPLPGLSYRVRMNVSSVPGTSGFNVNTYSNAYQPGFLDAYITADTPDDGHGASALPPLSVLSSSETPGFLTLQLMVDRWAINATVPPSALGDDALISTFENSLSPVFYGTELMFTFEQLLQSLPAPTRAALAGDLRAGALRSETFAPQQVDLVPFPVPQYTQNIFYQIVLYPLTLLFVIAFVYPVSRLISALVQEKELKLRESMRIMGTSDSALLGSWFLSYATTYFILSCLITLVGTRLFPASSPIYVFALFFTFALSTIPLCMFISVFFTQSKVASVIGSALFIAGYFPFFSLSPTSSPSTKSFAALLSPTSLGTGLEVLASLETAGVGAVRDTVSGSVINNWTVASSIGMNVFDTLLFLALASYADAVLPAAFRDFGTPRPFYFPFTPSFWREVFGFPPTTSSNKRGSVSLNATADSEALLSNDSSSPPTPFIEALDASLEAKVASGRCVSLRGLRKEFDTPDGIKVAVDSIDLDMMEGQIFVLLGHNGAGKTTTLSMLSGMTPATAGHATVFGRGLENLSAIRGDLGVCPQHDVLWPELTVNEHLYLFAALKGVPAANVAAEAARSLELVGLTEKALVRVAALSGGQKRKLSVCLAFLGGSKVVFLDEPTSGMDPYSRRSTWNILRNAREGRVIVLTTHFMDEADILGDRIAIMSEGRVKCCGGALFLKEAFGIGYTMTIIRDGTDAPVLELVREHVPSVTIASSAGAELALRMPIDASPSFSSLLRNLLGPRGAAIGVRDVGVGVTSVEDVFMRVAAGESHEASHSKSYGSIKPSAAGGAAASLEDVRRAARAELGNWDAFKIHSGAIFTKRARYARRDVRAVCCLLLVPVLALVGGLGALLRSAWGDIPPLSLSTSMFNNDGNRGISGVPQFPDFVNVFAFKSGLGMASPGLVALTTALPSPDVTTTGLVVPTADAAASALDAANFSGFITSSDYPLRDWQRMSSLLLSSAPSRAASVYGSYVFTGPGTILPSQDGAATINASAPGDAPLTFAAFVNTTAVHGGPIFANLLSTASLRVTRGGSPSVAVASHPLPLTAFQKADLLSAQSFTVVQVVMLALAFVSPAFMNFVVRERESSAKHQQLISGVSIPAYWIANLGFDLSTYVVPASLSLVTLKAFNAGPIISSETDNAAALVAMLFAYGISGTTSTYAFSHIFKSPAGASAASVMVNILMFAGVIACFVLQGIQSTCKAVPIVRGILNLHPFFAFGTGLSNIASIKTLPQNLALCDLSSGSFPTVVPFTSSFNSNVAGGPLLYLFLTSVMYLVIAIVVDYARNDMSIGSWLRDAARAVFGVGADDALPSSPSYTVDRAVAAEAARVDAVMRSSSSVSETSLLVAAETGTGGPASANSDAILISRLRKVFPPTSSFLGCFGSQSSQKVAVADVSFGVAPGEVFGFLGINGAGKTTTLRMLTGDELPSSGRALLGGFDIIREQSSVRRLLGCAFLVFANDLERRLKFCYPLLPPPPPSSDCPQFDALLDLLTSREHLELYARIKGVPLCDLKGVVDDKLREFDLLPFENKLAGRLSGGNKRKLSVAIALIGNPPILFLDEPSTGVDPVAKRFMWRIISRVATEQKQCAVMLTTHSMEEVSALSTRIGIMVGGRLRCLGSAQELRSAHGAGFSVELRLVAAPLGGNPLDAEAALNRAAAAAEATVLATPSFKGAQLCERQGSLLKFRVPRGAALADLFAAADSIRVALGAGTTLTIGETSLEEIFNTMAATQTEERGAAPGLR